MANLPGNSCGSDADRLTWRDAFIATNLESGTRDPGPGPGHSGGDAAPPVDHAAHHQGGLLNPSQRAASLGIRSQTVDRYIDLLGELMLVRRLPAWHGNLDQRLVRAPKDYARNSGIVHAQPGLGNLEALLGHPVAGASWKGFVVEQLLAAIPQAQASCYRTGHGEDADLVLEFRDGEVWLVEVKRSAAPIVSRSLHQAAVDVGARLRLLSAPVERRHPLPNGIEVMPPLAACHTNLRSMK